MDTKYIAFITLSTGSKHKITEETYNQILQAEKDDFIVLPNGTTFKTSAVMEIQDIAEWVDEKGFSYGQPVTVLPAGKGYEGIIKSASKTSHLEALARGLKKAKERLEKQGRETPNIDKLIEFARERYLLLKH